MTGVNGGLARPMIRGRQQGLGAGIFRSCDSTPRIQRPFTLPASSAGNQSMAARHGTDGAVHREATIIRTFGLIPIIQTSFSWGAIRARLLPSTAAGAGVPGITNLL